MSDPMGFFSQDFAGIEYSEGRTGGLVPTQYAKVIVEDATYAPSKTKQTPEVTLRLRCDDIYALTPKRTFFHRFWLTDGSQAQVDGITRAFGLGRFNKRFGEPASDKDPRKEKYAGAEFEVAANALAAALKGRSCVGLIDTEVSEGYKDKNRLANHYQASEENLKALLEGQFDAGRIDPKSSTVNGVRSTKLVGRAAGAVKATAGTPAVV